MLVFVVAFKMSENATNAMCGQYAAASKPLFKQWCCLVTILLIKCHISGRYLYFEIVQGIAFYRLLLRLLRVLSLARKQSVSLIVISFKQSLRNCVYTCRSVLCFSTVCHLRVDLLSQPFP